MTINKGDHISNNEKKDWFSHETGLVFVHGKVGDSLTNPILITVF